GETYLSHGFQHPIAAADIRHARVGVGGGARRVILHGVDVSRGLGAMDLLRLGVLGGCGGLKRLEIGALRQHRQDALSVFESRLYRGHGGLEVRHDDGAGEARCSMWQHVPQEVAVPEMQVPVVGAGELQFHHLDASPWSSSRSSVKRTPKPVTSVGMWASPPLCSPADRSTCTQGTLSGTKRPRKRAAR